MEIEHLTLARLKYFVDLFYQQVKSQLLEMKWVFKHQDLYILV